MSLVLNHAEKSSSALLPCSFDSAVSVGGISLSASPLVRYQAEVSIPHLGLQSIKFVAPLQASSEEVMSAMTNELCRKFDVYVRPLYSSNEQAFLSLIHELNPDDVLSIVDVLFERGYTNGDLAMLSEVLSDYWGDEFPGTYLESGQVDPGVIYFRDLIFERFKPPVPVGT